jgi:8-oxo-dGTP pyrophosphatase MutT (NUDIX family)
MTPIIDASKYPEVIHGTFKRLLPQIFATGLSRMSRNHIHFAAGSTAISGIRGNTNVFIYADLQAALSDGIEFYVSDNGVILTPGNVLGILEPKYFKKVVDLKGNDLLKPIVPNIPCAGVIVFNNIDEINHVCLVSTHANVYGFPKGKRNKKEELMLCGLRELFEETGIKDTDIEPLSEDKYVYERSIPGGDRKGNISTKLYVTKLINKNIILKASDIDEIAVCKFVPISEAIEILMDKRKIVLQEALALLN